MDIHSSHKKARHYIEKHSKESAEVILKKRKLNPGPTITISRETGLGAEQICEKLVEFFEKHRNSDDNEWAYFDKELIDKVIEDHNLPPHFHKFFTEEHPKQFEAMFGQLLGVTPSKILLLKKVSQTVYQLGEYGNVIIVGRGANIITSDLRNAFHVRLVAPLNFRIEKAMHLYHHNRKATADFIKKEDKKRKQFIKVYFHRNIDDPLLYHLVINANLLSSEEIADMIGNCVLKKFKK
ncbi:MAG: cytidylate kinase-like family protein [Bacteroidetes bacterium]|nr:cytidylate kinase-like family protein [Bacteroidota bacterium]MBU1678338.1 cytidylate kinase-like family protein [Bacteroidota bacterium]MBU2507090.1 cytidylate kinase-like family protein [Bacteroidota bacterium]